MLPLGVKQSEVGEFEGRVVDWHAAKVMDKTVESQRLGELDDGVNAIDHGPSNVPLHSEVEGVSGIRGSRDVVRKRGACKEVGWEGSVKVTFNGRLGAVVGTPVVTGYEGRRVEIDERLVVVIVLLPVVGVPCFFVSLSPCHTVLDKSLGDVGGRVLAAQWNGRE